jgi:hypothetical protein
MVLVTREQLLCPVFQNLDEPFEKYGQSRYVNFALFNLKTLIYSTNGTRSSPSTITDKVPKRSVESESIRATGTKRTRGL